MRHQPVKQGQTTTPAAPCPTLCEKCVGCLTYPANSITLKMQETEPTVYSPYPRRQECLLCNRIGQDQLIRTSAVKTHDRLREVPYLFQGLSRARRVFSRETIVSRAWLFRSLILLGHKKNNGPLVVFLLDVHGCLHI